MGLWQGVGICYASRFPDIGLVAAFAVLAFLIFDYIIGQDAYRDLCTLLGVGVGVLCTELLSQFFDTNPRPYSARKSRRRAAEEKRRLVHFNSLGDGQSSQGVRDTSFHQRIVDITSVDSNSDVININKAMTPLEREVAALRARASLADSERRRYKEEKTWAEESGNSARAEQMRWQVFIVYFNITVVSST
jgi:hypothetical protein